MTFRLILWFIIFIASIVSAQLKLRNFPHILVIFLLFMPVVSLAHALFMRRRIRISYRRTQEFIPRGEKALWQVTIKNPALHPMVFHIKENQAITRYVLEGKGELSLEFGIRAEHTGPLDPPDLSYYLQDSFNLFRIPIKRSFNNMKIYALPLASRHRLESTTGEIQEHDGAQAKHARTEHLDDIHQLRAMTHGDPLKLIHWKLSARQGEWMVKEYRKEEDPSTLFLTLLPQENLSLRDSLLDLTYQSAKAFLYQQLSISLYSEIPEPLHLQASSLAELEHLRAQLGRVPHTAQQSLKSLLFHVEKRDNQSLLLLCSTLTPEDIRSLKIHRDHFTRMRVVLYTEESMSQYNKNLLETLVKNQIQVTEIIESEGSHAS